MILRTIVLVIAAIAFAGALSGTLVDIGVWPSLLVATLFLVGILFERVRYGAAQRRPAGGTWQETTERFIDDESGRPVTVWFDPATGKRRYVDSGEGESP
ncbi:MAG: hypothetical protein V4475_16205 [Pseudomonadota bacterium]